MKFLQAPKGTNGSHGMWIFSTVLFLRFHLFICCFNWITCWFESSFLVSLNGVLWWKQGLLDFYLWIVCLSALLLNLGWVSTMTRFQVFPDVPACISFWPSPSCMLISKVLSFLGTYRSIKVSSSNGASSLVWIKDLSLKSHFTCTSIN